LLGGGQIQNKNKQRKENWGGPKWGSKKLRRKHKTKHPRKKNPHSFPRERLNGPIVREKKMSSI
jgi:hypothetical protein